MSENNIEELIERKAKEITETTQNSLETATTDQTDENQFRSFTEQAKDIVGALATRNAIQDENLVEEITDRKREELKESASASLKKEKAESRKAEIELQGANYGVFEGVATYAGIKKPLPQKMQQILFTTLSFFQMIVLVLFGIPTSIVNITADCIDSTVKKLSSVAKSARVFVLSLVGLVGIFAVAFIIKSLLAKFNII